MTGPPAGPPVRPWAVVTGAARGMGAAIAARLAGDGFDLLLLDRPGADLAGARACGLRTAYIERPLEFGAARPKDVSPRADNDLHAASLTDLAQQLGASGPQAATGAPWTT